jgi:hypothetical protein
VHVQALSNLSAIEDVAGGTEVVGLHERSSLVVVGLKQLAITLTLERRQQPRRALDVREQEGERSGRESGRSLHRGA